MSLRHLFLWATTCIVFVISAFTAAQTKKVLTAEEIFAQVSKSVVKINTDRGSGTGFFTESGKLYTAAHVIEDALKIEIVFSDGLKAKVDYIDSLDKTSDIAVLMTNTYQGWEKRENGPALADFDSLKTGESIYVIGNPKGLDFSITQGILSAKRKMDERDVLQISATSTYGSSGSPVLNRYGEVIGIVTSGVSETGQLNFAASTLSMLQTIGVRLTDLAQSNDVILDVDEDVQDSFENFKTASKNCSDALTKLSNLLKKLGYAELEKALPESAVDSEIRNACSTLHEATASVQGVWETIKPAKSRFWMSTLIDAFDIGDDAMEAVVGPISKVKKKKPTSAVELEKQLNECYIRVRLFVLSSKLLWAYYKSGENFGVVATLKE